MIDEKQCTQCKQTLPLTEFYKDKRTRDGHYSECKACTKARRKKDKLWDPSSRTRVRPRAPGINHKVVYNRQFFDKWSPDMAYVLGVVFADGCVTGKGLRLQFGKKDREILDNISMLLNYPNLPTEIDSHGFPSWYIIFYGIHMVERLFELGIPLQKKAKIIHFPVVPDKYQRHFIRGFFDGDGCATHKQVKFASSSPEFLEGIHQVITSHIGPNGGKVYHSKKKINHTPQGTTIVVTGACQLIYCALADRLSIYQFLYHGVPDGSYSQRKEHDFATKGLMGEYRKNKKLPVAST